MIAGVRMHSRWHRLIEAILPWYSPEEERQRDAHTEAIRRDAIAARMKAERVREAYRLSGQRTRR